MNVKLILMNRATGLDEGTAASTQQMALAGKGLGGSHVVRDIAGNRYPHFFDKKPMYIMKNIAGKTLVNGWHESTGECFRSWMNSPDSPYYKALRDSEGPDKDALDPTKWVVVDHKNRIVRGGREYNWEYYMPQEPGTFALVKTLGGIVWAYRKTRGKHPAWMKYNGLWTFIKKNNVKPTGVKVAENLGGGKWHFREDLDPWI